MSNELLIPMAAHVAWTALLYAVLTLMRAPKIWNIGKKEDGSNPWQSIEPKVSANLSNQFEWPLFFYAACLVVIAAPALYQPAFVLLAWIFIAGRVIHSAVQIFTTNIRLRGVVFTINFLAVLSMWCLLLSTVSGGAH
ncbi:MAPEG family protein [Microbulbifer pacificus]|uniref:MAPEG family protein n=1 Tax=Microbulbifer pacificus TaxID=407164 RepID=A0AAU0MV55_9GAMM|nr:MAPEG family protein [Microbulbifer pacificus]WOX04328.1 MAPEG family protein [Microbulbifer pacificus]